MGRVGLGGVGVVAKAPESAGDGAITVGGVGGEADGFADGDEGAAGVEGEDRGVVLRLVGGAPTDASKT